MREGYIREDFRFFAMYQQAFHDQQWNSMKPLYLFTSVHKDISERLPQFNRALYLQVKEVLEVNKAQRHIRGGIATRKKYRGS